MKNRARFSLTDFMGEGYFRLYFGMSSLMATLSAPRARRVGCIAACSTLLIHAFVSSVQSREDVYAEASVRLPFADQELNVQLRSYANGDALQRVREVLAVFPPSVVERFAKGTVNQPALRFFDLSSADFNNAYGCQNSYAGFYRLRDGVYTRVGTPDPKRVLTHECFHALEDYIVEDECQQSLVQQKTFEQMVRESLLHHKTEQLLAAWNDYSQTSNRLPSNDEQFQFLLNFYGNPSADSAACAKAKQAVLDPVINLHLMKYFVSDYSIHRDPEYRECACQTDYFAENGEVFYYSRALLESRDPKMLHALEGLDAALRQNPFDVAKAADDFRMALQ